MILSLYAALLILGIVLCTSRAQGFLAHWLLFLLIAAYFVATRLSPPQADFITYTATLRINALLMLTKPYFIKEWAYWLPSSIIYSLTKSAEVTFLVFDLYSIWAIFQARRNLGLPLYFCAVALLIFSSVFGVHNVYRQYLATCTLLLALSYDQSHRQWRLKRWGFFILAGFFHNAAILFAPLLFVYRLPIHEVRRRPTLFIISAAGALALLPIAASTKSSVATGASFGPIYAAIMILFLTLMLAIDRGVIWLRYRGVVLTGTYFAALSVGGLGMLGAAPAERIGMMALFLTLPIIIWYIENRVLEKRVMRIALIVFCAAPSLLFPSAFRFLQGA